jgi:hypothetical protein
MIRSRAAAPRPLVIGAALLALLVSPGRGLAAPSPSKGRTVAVHLESGPLLDAPLVGSLRELLARRGALLLVGDAPGPPANLRVRVVDADRSVRVVVQPLDRPDDVTERPVAKSASPSLFRETLAHAIFGAVEPSLEPSVDLDPSGISVAVEEQPPPAPESTSVASLAALRPASSSKDVTSASSQPSEPLSASATPPPSRWPLSLRLAANVGPRWAGAVEPTLAAGGAVALGFDGPRRPTVAVEAACVLPFTVEGAGLVASVAWLPIRLPGRFEPVDWGWGRLELGGAVGVDRFAVEVLSTTGRVSALPDVARLQPIHGAALGARLGLGPVELSVRGAVEIALVPRRWVAVSDGVEVELLELGLVRPAVLFGVEWAALRWPTDRPGRSASAARRLVSDEVRP